MDDAASRADRIRVSRGNYDAEVSCTGERGLHQCLRTCQKNPGHDNFIPTNCFSLDHLPLRYRDKLLVDYVRATSDLTCRLSVSCISGDRPDTWPDSDQVFPFSATKGENFMMSGTGWMSGVAKYTEELNTDCPCEECSRPGTHTPKKTWGYVHIHTALHVVYNNEEARDTKCQFFYDSPETDINKVLTLSGLKVYVNDIKGDWCKMKYVTHDVELLDRFLEMYCRWYDLRLEVKDKYMSNNSPDVSVPSEGCDTDVVHDICIVVSHPHGCTKQISVGTWTHRHVVEKDGGDEYITYSYNTPTCPGSSGAPVITLCKDNRFPAGYYNHPPHSQGRPGNDNNSGVGLELV